MAALPSVTTVDLYYTDSSTKGWNVTVSITSSVSVQVHLCQMCCAGFPEPVLMRTDGNSPVMFYSLQPKKNSLLCRFFSLFPFFQTSLLFKLSTNFFWCFFPHCFVISPHLKWHFFHDSASIFHFCHLLFSLHNHHPSLAFHLSVHPTMGLWWCPNHRWYEVAGHENT